VTDKPDWGHGPNTPVRTFTIEQIGAALRRTWPFSAYPVEVEAFLDKLRRS